MNRNNIGDCNTGDLNTGDCNTGNRNTGDWNTGDLNTGNRNTGNWNTGNRNTGDCNTGNRNTGDCNTGDCNTGNWNTGDLNTGKRNTGDWNTGCYNTGYCNSETHDECFIFDKLGSRIEWMQSEKPAWMYVSLTKWVEESEMSNKEKQAYPSYVTTGGYLKCYTSLTHAYVEAWEKSSNEDRELTKKLPNFDPVVFEKVFGFNPFKSDRVEKNIDLDVITVNGKKYQLIKE